MLPNTPTAGTEPAPHTGAMPDNPNRLIDIAELGHLLGCKKTKVYAELADPESPLPRPVKHGRSTRWVLGEVQGYIADLVAQRDSSQKGVTSAS